MEICLSDYAPAARHLSIWVSVKHQRWDAEQRKPVFCGWAGGYVPICNTKLVVGSWRLHMPVDDVDLPLCQRCRRIGKVAGYLAGAPNLIWRAS